MTRSVKSHLPITAPWARWWGGRFSSFVPHFCHLPVQYSVQSYSFDSHLFLLLWNTSRFAFSSQHLTSKLITLATHQCFCMHFARSLQLCSICSRVNLAWLILIIQVWLVKISSSSSLSPSPMLFYPSVLPLLQSLSMTSVVFQIV